ncbi:META domain-containing protein [Deinococcus murrayi]|uniref:META domain-containing protein n=1 Tax=Deinococcus murrayi TaxID=68910 RepID=UPI0006868047|nr:META domain-containing protein [Deinococcus murrayi]
MRPLSRLVLTPLILAGAVAPAQASSSLLGVTWTLSSVQEDGQSASPLAGAPAPTLRFDERAAFGTAGCNTYRATYASREAVLRFGPLATTRRGCTGAVAEQETRFLNLLRQVTGFQQEGQTLTLWAGARSRLVFRASGAGAVPQTSGNAPITLQALEGTWQLSGGTALRPVPATLPTLSFAGGRVSGSTGCNRLGGSVEGGAGGQVTFGPLATTRMACPPAVSAQETAFLRFLAQPALAASLQGQTLTLRAASGQTLVFRRSGGAAGTVPSLAGGRYVLTAVAGRPVSAAVSRALTLNVEAERLSGSDGCNQFAAPYRLEGAVLVLTASPVTTLRACPDAPAVPVQLPAFLASRPSVTVTAAGLTLRAEDGTVLSFTRL